MIIRIISQIVEYHTPEQLAEGGIRKMEFSANQHHCLVAVGIGIHGSQGLRMQFIAIYSVESLCHEVPFTICQFETTGHHIDTGLRCHFIIGHFEFCRRTFCIAELEDMIVESVQSGNLSGAYLSRLAVNRNDSFRLSSSGRCTNSHQQLLGYLFVRCDMRLFSIRKDFLRQMCQVSNVYRFCIRHELRIRFELQSSHSPFANECQLIQRCNIRLSEMLIGTPMFEQRISPIVRERIRDERRQLLIDSFLFTAIRPIQGVIVQWCHQWSN